MSDYKYPYINDKRLYAATMCACRMIRETGWFNKGVQYAADQYGFSFEDVANQVRIRQAAGQRHKTEEKKARGEKATYKWFIYCIATATEARPSPYWDTIGYLKVGKARSFENLYVTLNETTFQWSKRNDTGSVYAIYYLSDIYGEYATKAEAESHVQEAARWYEDVNDKFDGWIKNAREEKEMEGKK